MEFKVGQIVRLTNNEGMAAEIGAIAIVKNIRGQTSPYIFVEWKRDSKWNGQGDGGYFPRSFTLAIQKGAQLVFNFME